MNLPLQKCFSLALSSLSSCCPSTQVPNWNGSEKGPPGPTIGPLTQPSTRNNSKMDAGKSVKNFFEAEVVPSRLQLLLGTLQMCELVLKITLKCGACLIISPAHFLEREDKMSLHFSSERPEEQFYTDFGNLNKFGNEVRDYCELT